MPHDTSVHAIIPLSLLEALRNLDTPVEDGLEELTGEIVAKRLGLSATVTAQIQRYRSATGRGQRPSADEAVGVFRLVGRRTDAPLVFADAGRRAARHAARVSGLRAPGLLKAVPGFLGRAVGRGWARRAARKVLRAELTVRAGTAEAVVLEPLSILAVPDGRACAFYGAALAELLRGLAGFEGAMVHEACRGRGDAACRWRGAAMGAYQ